MEKSIAQTSNPLVLIIPENTWYDTPWIPVDICNAAEFLMTKPKPEIPRTECVQFAKTSFPMSMFLIKTPCGHYLGKKKMYPEVARPSVLFGEKTALNRVPV